MKEKKISPCPCPLEDSDLMGQIKQIHAAGCWEQEHQLGHLVLLAGRQWFPSPLPLGASWEAESLRLFGN